MGKALILLFMSGSSKIKNKQNSFLVACLSPRCIVLFVHTRGFLAIFVCENLQFFFQNGSFSLHVGLGVTYAFPKSESTSTRQAIPSKCKVN